MRFKFEFAETNSFEDAANLASSSWIEPKETGTAKLVGRLLEKLHAKGLLNDHDIADVIGGDVQISS